MGWHADVAADYARQVVELTRAMIRHDTVNPPGQERRLAEYLAHRLEELGLSAEVQAVAEDRANVIGRITGSGEAPPLILCGHLDTVPIGEAPWRFDPFAAEIAEGKIWGRGTSDMKSGLAAAVVAAGLVAASGARLKGDLIVAGTAGEEVDRIGAIRLIEGGVLPAGPLLIAEPSENEIYTAEKGALWLEIVARGRAAHGSMPELGVNAIEHLARAVLALRNEDFPHQPHPLLGRPTLNVGTIRGGSRTNIVADSCAVTVDIRTVPGQDHGAIVRQVTRLLDRIGAAGPECPTEVRVLNDAPPIETDAADAFVRDVVRSVADAARRQATPTGVMYYTDAAALVPALNVPMAICGPGRKELAHQVDEYVEINTLIEAVGIYRRLIELRLIGSNHG